MKDLEKALDKFVEPWAKMNESRQVQEEMKCYDDQIQGPTMGVPRMLQQLDFLEKHQQTPKRFTKKTKKTSFIWGMGNHA